MLNSAAFLSSQTRTVGQHRLQITSLDAYCNSLKVAILKGEEYFQETISVYDFVDIRKKMKKGLKLQEINKMSLLFLKLMLASKTSALQIRELNSLPWKKILRGESAIALNTKQRKPDEPVRGLSLLLSPTLAVVVPLVLTQLPSKPRGQGDQAGRQIKKMFFDQIKQKDV